jgi:asparagine synthase (glutamine-hydrolysing)
MAAIMNQPVKTFTIGFKDTAFDERVYAHQVANRWHTDHTELVVDMDAMSLLPEIVKHYGEPFGDVSAMPMWYLSRLARQSVPMVLSGDAGDELFAGYEEYSLRWSKYSEGIPYHLSASKKWMYRAAHLINRGRFPYRKNDFESWYNMSNAGLSFLWKDEIKSTLQSRQKEILRDTFEISRSLSHFQKAQLMDFHHYLPDDVLFKSDVATMSQGLEMRTPLLDLKVVEWASTLPSELTIPKKHNTFQPKYLLKKILSRYFSEEFIHRPKKGFTVPMDRWMNPHTKEGKSVLDRLMDSRSPIHRYFKSDEVKKVLKMERKEQTWKLLVLEEWLEQN